MLKSSIRWFSLCALAACAGAPAPTAESTPLHAEEWFTIDYRGFVGSGEGLSDSEVVPTPAPVGAAAGMRPVLVTACLWRVEGSVARHLLSDGARELDTGARDGALAIGARVAASGFRDRMTELVAQGRAVLLYEPQFNCDPGRLISASVVEQAAFVSGFQLHSRPSSMIADPIIGTTRSGVVWSIHCDRAEASAEEVEVRVGLTTVENCAPMQTLRGRLLRGAEFALQAPLQCRQSVSARTVLKSSEGLLLAGMCTAEEDAQFVALLTADAPTSSGLSAAR